MCLGSSGVKTHVKQRLRRRISRSVSKVKHCPHPSGPLSNLCRVEGQAAKVALAGVVRDHPQALYYSLRSFFVERREIERSMAQSDVPLDDDDAPSSARISEELMSNLRKAHPVLWVKLESMIEDLVFRFRPSYE